MRFVIALMVTLSVTFPATGQGTGMPDKTSKIIPSATVSQEEHL